MDDKIEDLAIAGVPLEGARVAGRKHGNLCSG